ncbi:hypothetical protein DS745_23170 [Anaerobacillus alkaliphilus]|uniref:Lipoprotein n=1 Tax=Anaerobacillus alkaliphilus TaxID=1548597 RepID=A0A4Q0VNF9_9BACI|nr:hypothetical protein [Anaerobacillus alkaliphilus]RXI96604.1 hypothetical protein DS745_23170 [Anaerobacillus alkaliphilus]
MKIKSLTYLLFVVIVLSLISCSQSSALPIAGNVDRIIVYTLNTDMQKREYIDVDRDKIQRVTEEINKAAKTFFDDPEPLGNLYLIVFQHGKKEKTFFYNDMLEYGGKIYSEKSAKKGDVWDLPYEFGELLLGEARIKSIDN